MIEISKIIYATLSTLNTKCFPIVAPESTTLPFVVYQRSVNVEVTKDGRAFDTNTITIHVLAEDYSDSMTISKQIDDLMQGLTGDVSGVHIYYTRLNSVAELYDSGVFIQKLEYEIKTAS